MQVTNHNLREFLLRIYPFLALILFTLGSPKMYAMDALGAYVGIGFAVTINESKQFKQVEDQSEVNSRENSGGITFSLGGMLYKTLGLGVFAFNAELVATTRGGGGFGAGPILKFSLGGLTTEFETGVGLSQMSFSNSNGDDDSSHFRIKYWTAYLGKNFEGYSVGLKFLNISMDDHKRIAQERLNGYYQQIGIYATVNSFE